MVGEVLESIKTGDLIICYLCRDVYSSSKLRFNVSVVEWQCKNETSIHRTAKHFSINSKHMGGRNRERKCRPLLRFVLRLLRLQKRGPYLRDTTVLYNHEWTAVLIWSVQGFVNLAKSQSC